mmetsp:Transcript_40414/g.96100  ORF Transcript_40414/g.96100 Transcript_40414/m.96100 type:complete len:82 (+) Transcript_40414:14-259(+)
MSEPEAIARAKERLQYVDCDAMVGFVEDIFVAQDVRTWAKVLSENNPRCEDMIKAVCVIILVRHGLESLSLSTKVWISTLD